jgi:hypothetical protein
MSKIRNPSDNDNMNFTDRNKDRNYSDREEITMDSAFELPNVRQPLRESIRRRRPIHLITEVHTAAPQEHQIIYRQASRCPGKREVRSKAAQTHWFAACQHFAYDRTGLSDDALLSLIWFREGVRPRVLYRRADGLVMTRECALAVNASRTKVALAAIAVALASIVLPGVQNLCATLGTGVSSSYPLADKPRQEDGLPALQKNTKACLAVAHSSLDGTLRPVVSGGYVVPNAALTQTQFPHKSTSEQQLPTLTADYQNKNQTSLNWQNGSKPQEASTIVPISPTNPIEQPIAPPLSQESVPPAGAMQSVPEPAVQPQQSKALAAQESISNGDNLQQTRPTYVWDARFPSAQSR